jgi:hypothetical protein
LSVLATCVALLAFGPLATAQAAGTSSIEGTVTSVKGAPLAGIEVNAVSNTNPGEEGSTTSLAGGKYTVPALRAGSYTVRFTSPTGVYLEKLETTVIETEPEKVLLTAVMNESSSLSGRVTSAATGTGLANVEVDVSGASGFYSAATEANGDYSITGMAPGSYFVEFFGPGTSYLSQSFSVSLVEGKRELNAALREGGKISGTVTNAITHGGLAKIMVEASGTSGGYGVATTNAKGEYTITGLPTGSYKVSFAWEFSLAEYKACEKVPRCIPSYVTQYYSGQPSAATANPVSATEGALTSGINAAMVPSVPTNTTVPVVSGTPTVGGPLSCTSGSWTGEPELPLSTGWPLTSPFGYQWLLEGVAIAGATSNTFVVQAADVGHSLVCEVTATNDAGHASAKSASFAVVKPVPVIEIASSKLSVSRRATKVSLACANAACAGSVQVVETMVTRHRKGHRTVVKKEKLVVASGAYSLAAGQTGVVVLHLTGAGKGRLARAPHHRLSVTAVASVVGGTQVAKAVQLVS